MTLLNIPPVLQIVLIFGSLLYLIIIFVLLKKRKLNVQYSIIWLGSALAFILVSVFPYLLAVLGGFLNVEVLSNLVFILLFAFVLLLLLSLSTIVTGFSEKIKRLAQTQSILEKQIRELEAELETRTTSSSSGNKKTAKK